MVNIRDGNVQSLAILFRHVVENAAIDRNLLEELGCDLKPFGYTQL